MSEFTPRKPDYKMKFRNRDKSNEGYIGAGWLEQSGAISIRLNPLVVIQQVDNLQITLFPNKDDRPIE